MTYQITRDGQLYGPYTLEDLRRFVASGNVLPGDLALPEDGSPRVPVAQLLNAPTPPPPFTAPSSFAPVQSSYAGPFADATAITGQYLFFPVTPVKFCVMSVCTFGFYQLFWAYKNWSLYQDQVDGHIMPWARAIFAGIWNFPLFSRVHDKAVEHEIPVAWNPVVLGVAVLLLSICSRLPHAISALVFLTFLAYLPVVVTIERLNQQQEPSVRQPLNGHFSGWNIAAIIVGGLFLLLALLGLIVGK